MNFKVKIDNRSFEVQVGDLKRQPVEVVVDGVVLEVWTSETAEIISVSQPAVPAPERLAAPAISAPKPALTAVAAPAPAPASTAVGPQILAPIPGVISNIFVSLGEHVKVGQELCVIEAMKMKNVIRANRSGRIARVHASTGQHIRHHQPLFDLEIQV